MNKIGLSALLLACVAFILLPDVSQAESDENLEILRKMQPVFQELLTDSSLSEKARKVLNLINGFVKGDLENPTKWSLVVSMAPGLMEHFTMMSEEDGLSDEAKKKLDEIVKLLGQLK